MKRIDAKSKEYRTTANGERYAICFLWIDDVRYAVSEEEYESSDDWTDGDIKDFLKHQLI